MARGTGIAVMGRGGSNQRPTDRASGPYLPGIWALDGKVFLGIHSMPLNDELMLVLSDPASLRVISPRCDQEAARCLGIAGDPTGVPKLVNGAFHLPASVL
jgi:hypothetical protein